MHLDKVEDSEHNEKVGGVLKDNENFTGLIQNSTDYMEVGARKFISRLDTSGAHRRRHGPCRLVADAGVGTTGLLGSCCLSGVAVASGHLETSGLDDCPVVVISDRHPSLLCGRNP